MASPTKVAVKNPYALKTATVLMKPEGSTVYDFSDHVSGIEFHPSSSSSSWTSVSGKTLQEASVSTWSVSLDLVQDLDQAGLLRFLMANDGKKCELLTTFKTGADPCKMTVTLSAANIGGKADGSLAESSVQFPVDGAPQWASGLTLT